MLHYLHRLSSPRYFYAFTERVLPWLIGLTCMLLVYGLYLSLFKAPADYQQGEGYRIMFVHVPAAWMSMFVYVVMAVSGIVGLVWHIKLAETIASVSAPIGAWFTLITLVTGSLWGKPMWGAWWVWDARLTSELILLFLYLGYISLEASIEDPRRAARAAAVLAIVGLVNIPVIHFSVQWWNTLHQGASVSKLAAPSIHPSMLAPLLVMALAFKSYYFVSLFQRVRCRLRARESHTVWVQQLSGGSL